MIQLVKYYRRSQTVHVQKVDEVDTTLCGRRANYEVVTATNDRLSMVSCAECRALYMKTLKGVNGRRRLPTVPENLDWTRNEGLDGLLQALTLTAAFRMGYVKALNTMVEAVANGYGS